MANVWFTADLHLGHGNIVRYCLRPYLSEAEHERAMQEPRGHWRVSESTLRRHDDALLDNVNAVVQPQDTLWVLGDFCWGRLERAREYFRRIRCRHVNLVWGNHDDRSIAPLFHKTLEQGMVHVEGLSIWLNP